MGRGRAAFWGEPPFLAVARHNGIRYFRSINLLGNSLSGPRADFATRSREKTLVDDAVSPLLSAFNAGMAGVWQCKPINSVRLIAKVAVFAGIGLEGNLAAQFERMLHSATISAFCGHDRSDLKNSNLNSRLPAWRLGAGPLSRMTTNV